MKNIIAPHPPQAALQLALDHVNDGVYIVDTHRIIQYWNAAATIITGHDRESVLGRSCSDHILNHVDATGKELCRDGCPLLHVINEGHEAELNLFLHHKDGHRIPITVSAFPLKDADGHIYGAIEVFNLACGEDGQECEAPHLGFEKDELTGAWTRKRLTVSIATRFDYLKVRGKSFGILFIDIDKFKHINDTYGHVVGDNILAMTSKTLMANVRAHDEVYRYGGEEFVVIVDGIRTENDLLRVAEKLRCMVQSCFILYKDERIGITISTGGVIARPDDNADALIAEADKLMYEAKRAGRNTSIVKPRA